MVRRCEVCGNFFEGPECPYTGTPAHPRPLPEIGIGSVVTYEDSTWLVVTPPDTDGEVGLMLCSPNVRVPLDDVKEI
jgi:hypothetical protein